MTRTSHLLVVLATVLLTACATTEDKIAIEYVPQTGVVPVDGAAEVVVDVQVTDARSDKSRVSVKKNGYGMEMAAIRSEEELSATVKRAIEQELTARGYKLGTDAQILVTGEITRFWNDFKIGFFSGDAVADFNMSVLVKSGGGDTLFSKQIIAEGKESGIQMASGKNAKLAIDRALDIGVKQLFGDKDFTSALINTSRR